MSWKINELEFIFIKYVFSYIILEFKLFLNPLFQNLSESLICLVLFFYACFFLYKGLIKDMKTKSLPLGCKSSK